MGVNFDTPGAKQLIVWSKKWRIIWTFFGPASAINLMADLVTLTPPNGVIPGHLLVTDKQMHAVNSKLHVPFETWEILAYQGQAK